MSRKPPLHLAAMPNGQVVLVDEAGMPVPASRRVTVTAAQLQQALIEHTWAGLKVGYKVGGKDVATLGASVIQQVADAGVRAGVEAGAKATAEAIAPVAADAGARYVLAHSIVRRRIERDSLGQIEAIVEEREPQP